MAARRHWRWGLLGLLALAAPVQADIVEYLHTDLAGSVVAVTDATGAVIERREYEPYGLPRTPVADGPGYTGHDHDPESGLVYMQQRYYDPEVGRFLSVDPVGVSNAGGNFNRYWYANNNPYRFTDPDGRRSVVEKDKIKIQVENKAIPEITIPNTVGAKGINPSDTHFHTYGVATQSNLTTSQAGDGFKNNPTPGEDAPASSEGTKNNVGFIPTAGDNNYVKSFTVASPDPSRFTNITVNYTIHGEHGLNEGFVIRYGEINADGTITLRSYGEGNNWRQSPALKNAPFIEWGSKVEQVWQQNHREIINGGH